MNSPFAVSFIILYKRHFYVLTGAIKLTSFDTMLPLKCYFRYYGIVKIKMVLLLSAEKRDSRKAAIVCSNEMYGEK